MQLKQLSLNFLKAVVCLIVVGILSVCIFVVPVVAKRDAAAHPETAFLQYPFIIGSYLLAIPLIVALFQVYKLLSNIKLNKYSSESSIRSFRFIKFCAFSYSLLIVVGVITIIALFYGSGEDITGLFMLALIGIVATSSIGLIVANLERKLQETLHNKMGELV